MNNGNKIETAVAELQAAYSREELSRHFMNRTLDNEFALIGSLFAAGTTHPDTAYVWLGYEICTDSKYLL